ncbi:5'-nucleotidase C-terminal domain-containing protein [Fonticella tunisiensis]|uniref:LPXTG-motif cell wall-anchored protein n=1 Tax=Fonticella tunisiensis TaxID=1096341 RepID=A0A4R7KAR4_9CLOT|nr:5'-nucleotidase C-terminal domain-containing protein [Fonticella tunisiensis]TDT50926.1 LPXTG-motif cell wall-anchored protein [Fonticella tunisiensis]
MFKSFKLKKWTSLLVALVMVVSLFAPGISTRAWAADGDGTINLQILATSDLHGRFMPYQYATDSPNTSGSFTQIATVVKQMREANPNTILVDNGDTIQDNSSQLFLNDDIHPMILAMNEMGYDSWTLGNHEFNYGVPKLEKVMSQFRGKVLGGNVYKPDGSPLAASYTIVERGGVKVGIVGMTNPNITKWDAANLAGYTVTSPVAEARKAVDAIKNQVDVLIGVIHVGPTQEYGNDDGADVIAQAIPEFAAIVAGHAHSRVAETRVNNVVITEPSSAGTYVSKIEIKLTKDQNGKYAIADRTNDVKSSLIEIKDKPEDEALKAKLLPYHERAIADARTVIGKLEGGDLVPENEVKGIPTSQIQDTAMIDLINEVQMYYSGAKVSAAAAFSTTANIKEGDITKAGVSNIYKYDNTLYKVKVTGAQLKKYMEWSASYYNTYKDGDLTISFNPNIRGYNYDMFDGVKYDVDISQEPGNRIKNLTWPDGTPVGDDEEIVLAVNNYRANTQLLTPGVIYEKDNMPELLEKDVRGDIGGVRELIADYIKNVKNGVITSTVNNNWKVIGNDWNADHRAKAVRLINEGKLSIPTSEDGRTPNVKSITWNDVLDVPDRAIDVVSFNDFHGSLKEDGKNIGAAKLAGEINKFKAENPNTVVVAAGDLYQGSAMSNLTYGAPVSEFLKSIGIEASAVGNHEFDWGVDYIAKWAKDGNFDFLASNIYSKTTKEPVTWAKPYKIVERDGLRIGFIGIATPETEFKTKPDNVKNLEFRDPVYAANEWAKYLKETEKVDFVVALTHLGAFQDSKTKEITGEAADFARNVKGVDAVISAHTHQIVAGYVNGIPVVQAYYNGRALVKITVGYNVEGKIVTKANVYPDLYKKADLVEDPDVKEIYDKYEIELKPILDEVIGTTDKELSHDRWAGVSLLGEWVSDVMRKAAGTQIAITNGGGIRTSIPQGNITMGKLYEVMPFDNTLVKMELKGSDILKNIDHGINNQEVGWVQFSGVKVYYDPAKPEGQRITSMRLLDGTKIEMEKYYTVVTNDFMAAGGDKYDFSGAKNMVDTGVPIRDAMVNELREVKNLSVAYVDYLIEGKDPADVVTPPTVDNDTSKVVDAVQKAPVKSNIKVDITNNTVVSKAVFEAIKSQDKTITFTRDGIEWTFNGLDIATPMDLDLSLDVPDEEVKDAILEKVKGYEPLIISFKHDGSLGLKEGAKATVKVKLDANWLNGKDTRNIFVYYYNPETKKAEKVAGPLAVDDNGYVTFQISHLSDYFIADKDLVQAGLLPKTGSVVDITGLLGLGGASMVLGAAFVVADRRKRNRAA